MKFLGILRVSALCLLAIGFHGLPVFGGDDVSIPPTSEEGTIEMPVGHDIDASYDDVSGSEDLSQFETVLQTENDVVYIIEPVVEYSTGPESNLKNIIDAVESVKNSDMYRSHVSTVFLTKLMFFLSILVAPVTLFIFYQSRRCEECKSCTQCVRCRSARHCCCRCYRPWNSNRCTQCQLCDKCATTTIWMCVISIIHMSVTTGLIVRLIYRFAKGTV
ncbi:variant erythrocyte surface antigen-1, alpha subunit [Babesia divergens]|uniref:Variant erythrocyte surface antigen-1, alpha subunit n=1 Tax=Babesia divergens TaxID=32595 RepID=A0AAD9GDC2_BABDI|nr:variant erythrocyte surface antigen-1, alpha subunit [Babesia divergens]